MTTQTAEVMEIFRPFLGRVPPSPRKGGIVSCRGVEYRRILIAEMVSDGTTIITPYLSGIELGNGRLQHIVDAIF